MIPLCERTVIAGKYQLQRELASGGMGAVWVARHLQLDAPVAVKFMSPALPESAVARTRFAREAQAAARLRGPHIVQVLDHGVDGDLPYIAMELLEGEHLGDRLKRERRLSLRAAAAIAAQVGKALGRAHRAGIVHRDLKPANVFLTRVDDEEVVKLLDFGIHKTMGPVEPEVTGSDVLMGSPQYMSPEQARGSRSVDHRADLWSLGAILFRAVTGVPAFDGVSAVDVIVQICTGPAPVATRVAPDLPPEIDAFFARALARQPEARFPSAREMTHAFDALVARAEGTVAPAAPRALEDAGDDPLTFVMPGRSDPPPNASAASGPTPRSPIGRATVRRVAVAQASAGEIESFVEQAFGAMLWGGSLPVMGVDAVPPTTRCPPTRTGHTDPPPTPGTPGLVSGTRPVHEGESVHAAGTGEPTPSSPVSQLIDQGFSALRRGEPDSARKAWEEALGLDPDNRMLALNLRRLDARGPR